MTIETTHVTVTATCRHCDNDTMIRVRVDYINDENHKTKDAMPEWLSGTFCKHCKRPMDSREIEARAKKTIMELK